MKSSKHCTTSGHWGELPIRETYKQEVVTPDIIENIWRQVIEETNDNDCGYMYRENDRQSECVELPMGNLNVLNTIHLQRQIRAMEDGTRISKLTIFDSGENSQYPVKFENSILSSSQSETKKAHRFPSCQSLQPAVADKVLERAVVVLLAHIGFEKSSDLAIETLTDIAKLFLRRMSLLLKVAFEQKHDTFPDAIERVLVESGIGGVVDLHKYYREYILEYEERVKRKAEKAFEEQRQMETSMTNVKMELDELANKFKFEELDLYQEVPTLQLLSEGFPPSLDAGFQMLNSLEVEEEDMNAMQQHSELLADKMKK